MTSDPLARLQRVADYQFGPGAGQALFPDPETLTIRRTSSGRPRQIIAPEGRLATYGSDGRFRLGAAGGRRLHDAFDPPRYRVVVGNESEPFVRDGKSVFSKFVIDADEDIRPGDEVLVIHDDSSLLAVGRAEVPGEAMEAFETGAAVDVRDGIDGEDQDEAGS